MGKGKGKGRGPRPKMAAALVAVAALLLLTPAAAFAGDGTNADGIDAASSVGIGPHAWSLVVDAGTWQLLNLLIVPVLVGLLVKATASARVKVFAMAGITGLSSLLALFVARPDGAHVLDSATLLMWAISAGISVLGHYGIYKPLGLTGSEPTSTALRPASGLG